MSDTAKKFALKEKIARFIIRRFVPKEVVDAVEYELQSGMFTEQSETKELPEHVLIEDRGAETTIFSFAGGALLFAGQPTFEFRKLLTTHGDDFNLVFMRDIHRLAYHLRPEGGPGGLDFYEGEVRRVMDQLGSKRYIALGDSVGGCAAIYYGTRCGMDHVIAMSPPCPFYAYLEPRMQLKAYFDLPLLFRSWEEFYEVAFITFATNFVDMAVRRVVGAEGVWRLPEVYLEAEKRPSATIFYGARCRPDTRIAKMYEGQPDVRLMPLDTAMHNTGAWMKKRGELATALIEDIGAALSRMDEAPAAVTK
ncbi:MAG: alpha/beta hydrolase [Candidatus Hydrogenedentes bacterium]|nr:alpha/beta hydrolase [Candidatus Hydrogenedentota bacterium]